MFRKYKEITKEHGWKELIRREGWKVGALLFTFFLVKGLIWLAVFYGLFELVA